MSGLSHVCRQRLKLAHILFEMGPPKVGHSKSEVNSDPQKHCRTTDTNQGTKHTLNI